MPYLIKGANVFTPKFLGKKDVLILEEKIAAIEAIHRPEPARHKRPQQKKVWHKKKAM